MFGALILIGMGWMYIFGEYCPTERMVIIGFLVTMLELMVEVSITAIVVNRRR